MRVWKLLTLAVLVLAVYGSSGGGGFHYDDEHSVAGNPHIRSLAQVPRFFVDATLFSVDADRGMYRPVLLTTYALDRAIHGGDAHGYLRTNLVIHALNAIFVAWLAWHLTGRCTLSLLAGALFGMHPAATEPVYYVSARSDSLVALFVLATSGLWLAVDRQSGWFRRSGWLTMAAALWTKATALMLPLVLLTWDLACSTLGRKWLLWRHAPLAGLSLVYLFCSWWTGFLPRSLAAPTRDLGTQLMTQAKAATYYLSLLFWPVGGSVHPAFGVADSLSPAVIGSALLVVAAAVAGVALWRSGLRRHVFLGVWVVAALLPTVLMPLNVLVNERRAYLPLAAFAIGAAWGLRRLRAVTGSRTSVTIGALMLFCLLSHQRGDVWASELTLWQNAVERGPHMARSRLYLGDAHAEAARNALSPGEEQQHRESAIVAYEAVISLEPGQRMLTLQAHNGLAILEWDAGDLASAQERLTSLLMEDPDYVDALVNLGGVHFSRARKFRGADRESLQQATQLYERALRLAPGRYEARLNLGACHHLSGDLPMAQAAYEAVVEQAPEDGFAALNLGTLYLQRARHEPRSADWHLLAQEQLQRAVRLLPGNESARRALAAALAGEAR